MKIIIVSITAILLAVALFMIVRREQSKYVCIDSGGAWVRQNCSTVMMPISCGRQCIMVVPVEECDEYCLKEQR